MKTMRLVVGAAALFAASIAGAQTTFSDQRDAMVTTALPQISVDGNRFVDPDGETVVFRGIAMADPAELSERGEWNRAYFEEAAAWHANVVRVPVHPLWWREHGEEQYLEWLDQAVQWSTELGMYVIIDWHTIGNLLTGVYHRDIYVTSRDETFRFWNTMAERYRGNTTVAFFHPPRRPVWSHALARLQGVYRRSNLHDLRQRRLRHSFGGGF